MMKLIDSVLNRITMYRLVLYYLIWLLLMAAAFSFLGILPYGAVNLSFSAAVLLGVCLITNNIFAKTFEAAANIESAYITALILALIISPPRGPGEIMFLFWAGVLSMASKYILAINKKHIFNPAAAAVAATAIFINKSASWWIGTLPMLPFVISGGYLIARKIRRTDLVWSFLIISGLTVIIWTFVNGGNPISSIKKTIADSAIFFFAYVMLTEPLTTPPTKILRVIYGAMVGFLFAPQVHFGGIYLTPEMALLAGNIFSYAVSPKDRLILKLNEKIKIAPDTYDFVFSSNKRLRYNPGQYMEWTLGHQNPDARGNRRYFTLASSPTENDVRIGIKFYDNSSSFKKAMDDIPPGGTIAASQLAGDFILPRDKNKKLVFIAGGIGITPFRSMIKYLIDKNDQRQITLFFANKYVSEIVYRDIFDEAKQKLGITTIYTLTDKEKLPADWRGEYGRVDGAMIQKYVPDFRQRNFYLSGPNAMVEANEEMLRSLGMSRDQIKTDYFPGFV